MERTKVGKKTALSTLAFVGLSWLAAGVWAPTCVLSTSDARGQVLRQDLLTVNQIVCQYTFDNHNRPRSLNDLVLAGYLKQVPVDPITGRNDTWILDWSGDPKIPGIMSVRSGSDLFK
ncbi:MAG TPA: hypothetical protein VH088_22010 [Terriglobales bacterium]|nr:hypothetical protein [Terriglobales bacterium]